MKTERQGRRQAEETGRGDGRKLEGRRRLKGKVGSPERQERARVAIVNQDVKPIAD